MDRGLVSQYAVAGADNPTWLCGPLQKRCKKRCLRTIGVASDFLRCWLWGVGNMGAAKLLPRKRGHTCYASLIVTAANPARQGGIRALLIQEPLRQSWNCPQSASWWLTCGWDCAATNRQTSFAVPDDR